MSEEEKEKNKGAYHVVIVDGGIIKKYEWQDKIRSLILKYRCFGWHNKDDEYWVNRILDDIEQLLEEE